MSNQLTIDYTEQDLQDMINYLSEAEEQQEQGNISIHDYQQAVSKRSLAKSHLAALKRIDELEDEIRERGMELADMKQD